MRTLFYPYIHGLVLCLCTIALVACSGSDDDPNPATTGKAIGFQCQTETLEGTRTTTDDILYFRVSAIWNKGNSEYEPFMSNQLVERQDGNWVYSPVSYWPTYGQVSFFAYSPATSAGLNSFGIDNTSNQVTITYEMSNNGEAQEDFLVATALDKADNPVHLQFEHALAGVRFWAKVNDTTTPCRINKITLNNLNTQGTLTGTAAGGVTTWAWSNVSTLDDRDVYQKNAFEVSAVFAEVGGLMVLPQVIDAGFEIVVTYNGTETTTYTLESGFEFVKGKNYSFYLVMDE